MKRDSLSFGSCEADQTPATIQAEDTLYAQAAARSMVKNSRQGAIAAAYLKQAAGKIFGNNAS